MVEKENDSRQDRRNTHRNRTTLVAWCSAFGKTYSGRIFEINHRGMTLLCDPSFPEIDTFQVTVRLKNARVFQFKVQARNRRLFRSGNTSIYRLGLAIKNDLHYMDDFLCEFAMERLTALKKAKNDLDQVSAEGHGGRGYQRLMFYLPAIAWVGTQSFRCQTIDVSTGGLSILVQEDFPEAIVFMLCYEIPDGAPIRLTAAVRYRSKTIDGQWQLGLRVMDGNRLFKDFLRKYKIWKSPES